MLSSLLCFYFYFSLLFVFLFALFVLFVFDFLYMFVHSDVHHFVLSAVFMFRVPCCDVHYDFCIKRYSVRLYHQLLVWGLMCYLSLCLFACLLIVESNTYCPAFFSFVFVLFLVYPILAVSLGCPLLIFTLVFSNVYLLPFRFVPSKTLPHKA